MDLSLDRSFPGDSEHHRRPYRSPGCDCGFPLGDSEARELRLIKGMPMVKRATTELVFCMTPAFLARLSLFACVIVLLSGSRTLKICAISNKPLPRTAPGR